MIYKDVLSEKLLWQAWKIVKKRGSHGGADFVSVAQYDQDAEERLADLYKKLQLGKWRPQPYLQISIPKKANERRYLGLLSVEDKVVQQTLKLLFEPRIEKTFLSCSYAYRPNKGHQKAVRRVFAESCKKDQSYFVRMDIDNFFDTINRELLMKRLRALFPNNSLCNLVELSIAMGSVKGGYKWQDKPMGLPQGAVLSPLLANFYLNSFDQFMQDKAKAYVRYADDFVFWSSSKEEALEIAQLATSYLKERMFLTLNEPYVGKVDDGFLFLGLHVDNKTISLTDEKRSHILEQLSPIKFDDGAISNNYLEHVGGVLRYYLPLISNSDKECLKSCLHEAITTWSESALKLSVKRKISLFKPLLDIDSREQLISSPLLRVIFKQDKVVEEEADSDPLNVQSAVRSRKLEYRRRESDFSELIISSFGYSLGVGKSGITLRYKGKPIKVPPASSLKHITILSDGVSISSNAIGYCMQNQIPIDFFDRQNKHVGSIVSPHFLQTTLWDAQHKLSDERSFDIGRRIIIGKLSNQVNLIKYYSKYHKEESVVATEVVAKMKVLLQELKKEVCIPDSNSLLMQYESQGALSYWEYVRHLLQDDDVGFDSRERRGATDLVNSMLNYGYALIYPRIWQALLKQKLNPYMGFIHYQSGNPNLVFDMIELFRCQAVDRVVISLIQKGEPLEIGSDGLTIATRKLLVSHVYERLQRYETYRGKSIPFEKIIQSQVRELAQSVETESTYKPYIAKW